MEQFVYSNLNVNKSKHNRHFITPSIATFFIKIWKNIFDVRGYNSIDMLMWLKKKTLIDKESSSIICNKNFTYYNDFHVPHHCSPHHMLSEAHFVLLTAIV